MKSNTLLYIYVRHQQKSLSKYSNRMITNYTGHGITCITCTLCQKIYIGETGRRLADRFREHLRDAEQNNTDAILVPRAAILLASATDRELSGQSLARALDPWRWPRGSQLWVRECTDASKPVARHFNLPNHSHHNMTICGLSLHHGNTESRKNLEQKFIFQLSTLSPHGINERLSFH